ncbi:putative GTP-binding protein EngB [Bacilli bacterium]|nr:putative GTP-binding protein EngB [Bacilli bacterium]GHU53575.1 putative GTP-binding protein EngB [Bacilli bacterium]
MINALAKEKIAITSNTPGRTQLVNFYDFLKFRLIDLPGYGYANVSKQKSYELNELIYEFIENRVNLFGVFLICDASVITDADRDMVRYFKHKFKNFYVILNKIDKIKDNELKKQLPKICQFLNIEQNNVIPISAKKNTNLNIVYKTILNIIKNK